MSFEFKIDGISAILQPNVSLACVVIGGQSVACGLNEMF